MPLIAIPLTTTEREFLVQGLSQWKGPARPTEALSALFGYKDTAALDAGFERIQDAIERREPLPAEDWHRTLLATELAFASDLHGAGTEWSTVTRFSDTESIELLRSLQHKLAGLL
ncbi:hypothetical protein AB0L40_10935 [Patulibacter sp. NPDC049589]|uniref:hypothetical protein n=1 Tax=Patulibacter sp. NPDC049589 TaxID=3154731 RepID=UPI003427188D